MLSRKSLQQCTIRDDSDEQRENRRALEKIRALSGNAKLILDRLVERWTAKAILMRSQEIKPMLLDSRGKAVLVVSWQRTCLSCVYILVFHGG